MKNLLLFILIFISYLTASAQQYYFKQYSTQEGLAQSDVFKMIEDKKGSLWMATNGGGICRLDGEEFTTFTAKEGLRTNAVVNLLEDSKKNIWLAYLVGGVSKYNGKEFIHYQDEDGIFEQSKTLITSIIEDKHKNIWVTTRQNILFLKKGDKFINYSKRDTLIATSIPSFNTTLDKNKNLVVSNRNGIQVFNGERFETKKINKPQNSAGKNLVFVYQDSKDIQWFVTFKGQNPIEIVRYDGQEFTPFKFPETIKLPSYTIENAFNMVEDKTGVYWFLFNTLGIVKYDVARERHKFTFYNDKNGFPADILTLQGIISDRENNIWINTRGNGIVKYLAGDFVNFFKKDGLPQEFVRGIDQDNQGNIWIGTSGNGFCKFDGEKIIRYPISENPAFGRTWGFIEEENENTLVLTTTGLRRLDIKNNTYRSVSKEFSLPPQLGIRSFLEEENQIIFGTGGAGVFFYDKKTKKVTKTLTMEDGLGGNVSWNIKKDSKGNYWIATRKGLSKYDGEKLTNFKDIPVLAEGLILDLCIDNNDNVWFVDYHTGLYVFDGQKITMYDKSDGLAASLVYSVAKDQEGDIWVGTQVGVSELSIDATSEVVEIKNYNKTDGLLGDEMNGKSILVDNQNNVWLGHIKGLSKYTPHQSTELKISPPITQINRVTPYLKEINWKDSLNQKYYDTLSRWNQLPQKLLLPYNKNNISFHFSSSSHTIPKKVRYQWKLVPLDNFWLSSTDKTEAAYPNLSAGSYVFRVRSMNHLGEWGRATSYPFKIEMPFWQTWWFILLAAVLILALLFLGFWARFKDIAEQKQELKRLVEERTTEVVEKNTELIKQRMEIIAQNEEVEQQSIQMSLTNKKITQKNRNITASITYAKRIQDAMLPLQSSIRKALPDSFIFYQPRDIVSGDFYWFYQKDDEIIIAAADCTGHGVPGAFMSLVVSNLMHNIIVHKGIMEPDKILSLLHASIYSYLKQDRTRNQDGVDIALCCINKKERKLSYAGAKNPLVYIKNNKLKVIKATKHSIGGFSKYAKKQLDFQSHVVELEDEPTAFYLYTDGFQDQFGGKQGAKFRSVPFRELLKKISKEPLNRQKKSLFKEFYTWRGTGKQIDDVLVIGFRV